MKLFYYSLLTGAIIFGSNTSQAQNVLEKVQQHHLSKKVGAIERQNKKAAVYPDSMERFSLDPFSLEYADNPNAIEYPSYDANGNLIEVIRYNPGFQNSRTKWIYTYTNGLETTAEYQEWDTIDVSWKPQSKYETYYDHKGIDSADLTYSYNPNNQQWILSSKYVYPITYDAQDRPVSTQYGEYDPSTQTWDYYERVRFLYNGNDTLPFEIYVDEYDAGNFTEILKIDRLEWGLGFTGNLDNLQPSLYMGYEWDGNQWQNTLYDSLALFGGKDYEEFMFESDGSGLELVSTQKFLHNAQGEQIYYETIDWSSGTADTSRIEIDSFRYGNNDEVLEHINRDISFLGSNKMIFGYKEIYYYGLNSVAKNQIQPIRVYPNPVKSFEEVFFPEGQTGEIYLYSMNGKQVKLGTVGEASSLRLPYLEKGVYVLILIDDAGNRYQSLLSIQ